MPQFNTISCCWLPTYTYSSKIFSHSLSRYSLHVFSLTKGINLLQYNMWQTMEQHSYIPDVQLHDQTAAPSHKLSTTYLKTKYHNITHWFPTPVWKDVLQCSARIHSLISAPPRSEYNQCQLLQTIGYEHMYTFRAVRLYLFLKKICKYSIHRDTIA
jgi:hypothetical protein